MIPAPPVPTHPFAGCLIHGCQGETLPIDLFCQQHLQTVPRALQLALDDLVRDRYPSMTRWRALVEQANTAAAATTGCRTDR